eukprot:8646108-Lingulodinium_polyedra.AAC.1
MFGLWPPGAFAPPRHQGAPRWRGVRPGGVLKETTEGALQRRAVVVVRNVFKAKVRPAAPRVGRVAYSI